MLAGGTMGEAGRTVVIESFLSGEEISVLALTDGREVELLPVAQDHKRLLEGDAGPNTGGMGAYSPVAIATPALLERVRREVLAPTLAEMRRRGTPFSGVLYAGLMIAPDGAPWVVEFNCRLGDPEAQVVLPLVAGGLTACLQSVADGGSPLPLQLRQDAAVTTVLAAAGYPDAPRKGAAIRIPGDLPAGVTVFHAGTTRDQSGVLRASGGRVLTVVGRAATHAEAMARAYAAVSAIHFDGMQFRRDIGKSALPITNNQ
jgi:phosphoribosylamine--glycine ligase